MIHCKFCNAELPPPPRRGRNIFVPCPGCGATARAKFYSHADGTWGYEYVWRKDNCKTVVMRVPVELRQSVLELVQNWRLTNGQLGSKMDL